MFKVLITTRLHDKDLNVVVVEFDTRIQADRAIEIINALPRIMDGYVSQFAQALY